MIPGVIPRQVLWTFRNLSDPQGICVWWEPNEPILDSFVGNQHKNGVETFFMLNFALTLLSLGPNRAA
jgi:hypothetical protein